ncbi:MAG: metallophosphoesterase [Yaniella sp.]|uniref:metallophosphoesterase family protein n=1 Tax=Yaniella sp. TaxID=2773929 RepID=UPI002648A3FA|nr:metallophosphoesterase [Yaniella sp.]MDN5815911.1 metallophosphoesterase [Yaniella sp.]MDN5838922.1 metallophosphoesterase [Yaniella sp.]MDN6148611.1 metallophosphoesterase [Yaniella sp.]MDN6356902.1 metallophosphoesterase [Yaniella sp.]MDN6410789.1 metallophosphoesterase [Yaniella sp.]
MTTVSPTLRLIQLSDLHLVEEGKLLRKVLDTPTRMREALDQILTFKPAAVILSGDIGQRNHYVHDDAAAYFGHFQDQIGIPFIAVGGNHDPIDSVGTAFNPGKIASGPELGDTVHDVQGLRVIGLDSHGVGRHQGHLTGEQLGWLRQRLAEPAEHGTLVVTHHPPIPSTTLSQRGSGLQNADELYEVIRETDVRAILSGHYHHQIAGTLGHIPVWVSGAASYNFDLLAEDTTLTGMGDGWATVVDVYDETVTFSSLIITPREKVFSKSVG